MGFNSGFKGLTTLLQLHVVYI